MLASRPFPRVRARLARARAGLAGLALPWLLAACATGSVAPAVPPRLFNDARFAPPAAPIDTAAVFALDDEMRDYLQTQILPAARKLGTREALISALYARSQLQLEYEATMTRNAAQAFEARAGNCLSLVIMTGAFAKALGLTVTFQEVDTDDAWSRAGGMYFMSGHVNLQLERHVSDVMARYDRLGIYTVDFLPGEDSVGLHTRRIGEQTILAMYLNNRAAEALAQGQLDEAYWRARAAVQQDPGFVSAYNTLAVVYLRHADAADARAVLEFALERAPDNPRMLSNYALALHQLGRGAEEAAARTRLARLEPFPPFHFFNLGRQALQAGDTQAARGYFRREIERAPDYHEFHYWLAVADVELGRLDEARSELALALADAARRSDRDLYAAKLDKIRAYRASSVPATLPARGVQ